MREQLPFPHLLKDERGRKGWTQADLAEKLGVSVKTINRWENGEGVPRPYLQRQLAALLGRDIVELGILNEKQTAPPVQDEQLSQISSVHEGRISADAPVENRPHILREDWGEAPHIEVFYGRNQEDAWLRSCIIDEHCKVIAISGMGGVGKTTLVKEAVESIKSDYTCIFWRSLQNSPFPRLFLESCIHFLSDQQQVHIPEDIGEQIALLLHYLRVQRCLIVLDNFESVMQAGLRAGSYREGYEGYGQLLRRIAESQHQSCLLLTSREKPGEIARLEGKTSPVRSLYLLGVRQHEGQDILREKELSGSEQDWNELIELYAGNPLALKIVGETIQEVFAGNIASFLAGKEVAFGDINELLEQQFQRLSELEQEVLYWLAIEREAVSWEVVREDLMHPVSRGVLVETFDSLRRRAIVETKGIASFTLQPVIMEYVTNHLIRETYAHFVAGKIGLWARFALVKAQTKDYIRESQRRLILDVLAEQLKSELGQEEIRRRLLELLAEQRRTGALQHNYLAGNVLNMLIAMHYDVHGLDCSHLTIRQAYLQNAPLADVDFSHAHFEATTFTNTFGSILSLAFSPDGKTLATGTATGEIWVYEMPEGTPLLNCHGHTDGVWSVAFSKDGRLLASGSDDQTVRLWDVSSGRCLKILQEHQNRVRSVAFSPQSHRLASGSDDRTIRLWDIHSGTCTQVLQGHTDRVWSVAFSRDGWLLVSGSTDQTVKLWDVANGTCKKTLEGHTDWVRMVVISPDERLLASGSDDQTIHIWDVETGQSERVIGGHTNRIWALALNNDGRLLASGGEDQTVRLWDMQTGQCLRTLRDHTSGVRTVAFSPDGRLLVSGGEDQTVRVWDTGSGYCLKTLQGHTNRIWSAALSTDGHWAISCGEDRFLRLWDVQAGQCLHSWYEHAHGARTVAVNRDGSLAVSGGEDHQLSVWKVQSKVCLSRLEGHTNWVRAVALSRDGQLLASGGEDHMVLLWQMQNYQKLYTLRGHESWIRAVAFSQDGALLASGSDDQTIRLWECESGQLSAVLQGHTNRVRAVTFHPAGQLLASGGEDLTVRFWDVKTGVCVRILTGHTARVMAVAFSPDGQKVVSGCEDSMIFVWDVQTGERMQILQGHTNRIRSIAFTASGEQVMSAGDDGTIRIWHLQDGTCVKTMQSEKPYERMNITGATGLTVAQKTALKVLGAIED